MKIKLYKSVALCSLLALAGCHDFEELNTNPYAPIYMVPLNLLPICLGEVLYLWLLCLKKK